MNFTTKLHQELTKGDWNKAVKEIPETAVGHTYDFIKYQEHFQNVQANRSFLCLDEQGQVLAICPLIFSQVDDFVDISSNGAAVFAPALQRLKPSLRRKLIDGIIDVYVEEVKSYNAKKGNFVWHPLNQAFNNGDITGHQYSFELLRYNMIPEVINTLVVDLSNNEESLSDNLSKYHKRNIKRARKQNITIEFLHNEVASASEIEGAMEISQDLHYQSAGKMTRPQETWDAMTDMVKDGKATIFLGKIDQKYVSFLYCGEYAKMAFGWSQANLKGYEQDYYVRHLLEWESIIFYKNKGFRFYELGERYYGPQLFHTPSEKELSISRFKQNYGGVLFPKIGWKVYFDDSFMEVDLNEKFEHYKTNLKATNKKVD